MPDTNASNNIAFAAHLADVLGEASNAHEALTRVDEIRRAIAGDSVFSIQQNVTTAHDAQDEIRLRRFFSSEGEQYPVSGTKRKTRTLWTERLFIEGRVFVGEGAAVLADHFDDYEQMRPYGLQSVINVPLLRGRMCYATFNVFGARAQWQPLEVLGICLLAQAASRWVPRAPGLAYRFAGVNITNTMEA